MTARRFRLEVAGQVICGLAFNSETELEQWLIDGGRRVEPMLPPVAAPQVNVEDEIRRGRPSKQAVICEAVDALGAELDRCDGLAARARLVLKHIAQTSPSDSIPGRRTVEQYLAQNQSMRRKERKKSRRKSAGAMMLPSEVNDVENHRQQDERPRRRAGHH